MDKRVERRLLERKFSSIEYMEEMHEWHQKAIDSLLEALRHFYQHPLQHEDWHNWHQSDWPETWEQRVLTNLRGTQESIKQGIENYRNGQVSTIRSASGSLHNIFRNLDNVGSGWWKHIPSVYEQDFNEKLVKASKIASNIMRELAKAWKTENSILNERITGPIDEKDLLRYLKPGEDP